MTDQLQPERQVSANLQCGAMVSGGMMSFPCTLLRGHDEQPKDDPEPHWAVEVPRAVREWQAWKRRQNAKGPEPEPLVHQGCGGTLQGDSTLDENVLRCSQCQSTVEIASSRGSAKPSEEQGTRAGVHGPPSHLQSLQEHVGPQSWPSEAQHRALIPGQGYVSAEEAEYESSRPQRLTDGCVGEHSPGANSNCIHSPAEEPDLLESRGKAPSGPPIGQVQPPQPSLKARVEEYRQALEEGTALPYRPEDEPDGCQGPGHHPGYNPACIYRPAMEQIYGVGQDLLESRGRAPSGPVIGQVQPPRPEPSQAPIEWSGWQQVTDPTQCPECQRNVRVFPERLAAMEDLDIVTMPCCGARAAAGFLRDHFRSTTPTKTRPGDQRLPDGGGECVQDVVIAAMEESKRVGIQRYNSVLRTFNGRKGFQDLVEEQRDAFVYGTLILREADATREQLVEVVHERLRGFNAAYHPEDPAFRAQAEEIVDRIMGWVTGQIIEARRTVPDSPDEQEQGQVYVGQFGPIPLYSDELLPPGTVQFRNSETDKVIHEFHVDQEGTFHVSDT